MNVSSLLQVVSLSEALFDVSILDFSIHTDIGWAVIVKDRGTR